LLNCATAQKSWRTQMPDTEPKIFISYAHSDQDTVEAVTRALDSKGLRIWSDREIRSGERWAEAIEKALTDAKIYLVFVSPESLASRSANFEMGVAASRAAQSLDVRLIPILLKGARWQDIPRLLQGRIGIDAKNLTAGQIAESLRNLLKND